MTTAVDGYGRGQGHMGEKTAGAGALGRGRDQGRGQGREPTGTWASSAAGGRLCATLVVGRDGQGRGQPGLWAGTTGSRDEDGQHGQV